MDKDVSYSGGIMIEIHFDPTPERTHKVCHGVLLPIEKFWRCKSKADGHQDLCKKCHRMARNEQRKRVRDNGKNSITSGSLQD